MGKQNYFGESQCDFLTYETHDNGARPFCIKINKMADNKFSVNIRCEYYDSYDEGEFKDNPKYDYNETFLAAQVFIGKSPLNKLTQFSGGHGEEFDGNSVLIKLENEKYVFIGGNIFSFNTPFSVVRYISPVGNNDVPYPYAVLENGDIYLMIEDTILLCTNKLQSFLADQTNDPYSYYYDKNNHCITPNLSIRLSEHYESYLNCFSYFEDIRKFHIGGNPYTMSYNSNPKKQYDRFKTFENLENTTETQITIFVGNELKKIDLTCDEYCKILTDFGNKNGFQHFESEIIVRDYCNF